MQVSREAEKKRKLKKIKLAGDEHAIVIALEPISIVILHFLRTVEGSATVLTSTTDRHKSMPTTAGADNLELVDLVSELPCLHFTDASHVCITSWSRRVQLVFKDSATFFGRFCKHRNSASFL